MAGKMVYGSFPYDLFALIAAVRERRLLWDRHVDEYKNKLARRSAWDEVCSELEPRYAHLDDEERSKMLSLVTTRWANMRDAFRRSLKLQKRGHKPYLYREQLRFLVGRLRVEPDTEELADEAHELEDIADTIDDNLEDPLKSEYRPRARKKRILRPVWHRFERPRVDRTNHSDNSEVDEDLAFFQSLLTPVRALATSEKMEFRIGVLTMLQHLSMSRRGDDEEAEEDEGTSEMPEIP